MTAPRTRIEWRPTAWVRAGAVFLVLLAAVVAGEPLLNFFGMGLPPFRVAGGILVLLMGISMLRVYIPVGYFIYSTF
ncbi:MAG: MarC family protein [Methylomonas sp.]